MCKADGRERNIAINYTFLPSARGLSTPHRARRRPAPEGRVCPKVLDGILWTMITGPSTAGCVCVNPIKLHFYK